MPSTYLPFALELAQAAGAHALASFRQPLAVDNKSTTDFDPVTQVDLDTETLLRNMIEARFPEHAIHGEEWQDKSGDNSPWQWILDPIDGTRAYVAGCPTWATLVGLLYEGEPVLGVAAFPALGEVFAGTSDEAWWYRGGAREPLRCQPRALGSSLLSVTTPQMFAPGYEQQCFQALQGAVLGTRFGLDAYGFCLVAAGWMQLVCEADLKRVDYLPLVPILRGAGAVVSDWRGRAAHESRVLACADASLRDACLALFDEFDALTP